MPTVIHPQTVSVVIVEGAEWKGLYVDKRLMVEGHSLDVFKVLDLLWGKTLGSVNRVAAYDDWLDARGSLPISLDEVELS